MGKIVEQDIKGERETIKIRETIIFKEASTYNVPTNKPNQGGKRPVLRKLHNTEERNQGRHKQMEAGAMLMNWKN